MSAPFTPDALVLRTSDKNGRSHGGFQWPLEIGAVVTCPDWEPEETCRNGLFGYLDGLGSRSNLSTDTDALWWIVEVERAECVVINNDKVKFPRARVAYFGTFGGALARLPVAMVEGIFAQAKASRKVAATTGDWSPAATTGDWSPAATTGNGSAAATTGYRSAAATTGNGSAAATTGDGSAATTTGEYSPAATTGNGSAAATTGYRSAAATTGYRSAAATTGYRSAAATTGEHSIAAALGPNSTASAGEDGAVVLTYWDTDVRPYALRHILAARVGEHGIEAGKVYRLNSAGQPVEVAE